MKLLGNTKYKITKVGNEENILHLGITEVVIVDSNIANNDYQHDLRVLYIFFQNKPIGELLDISSRHVKFLQTFNSDFSYIQTWFTVQNSKQIKIEVKKILPYSY